jgi:hypothetical protein
MRKIQLFKLSREYQRRIQELQRLLATTGQPIDSEESLIAHEDEIRELSVLKIKSFVIESINDIPMITQARRIDPQLWDFSTDLYVIII